VTLTPEYGSIGALLLLMSVTRGEPTVPANHFAGRQHRPVVEPIDLMVFEDSGEQA
jgi:hypothetical protein